MRTYSLSRNQAVGRAIAAGAVLREAISQSVFGILVTLGVLAATMLLCGCRVTSSKEYSIAFASYDGGTADYSTNSLQEGDVISITLQYSTNFNTTQKITLDGNINLEGIGIVKAAGKTCFQLQHEIEELYKDQTKNDPVTVTLISSAASVYVSGAVFRPGRISMERPMTALEAIMEAGGFEPSRAKLSNVSILRVENGRQKVYPLNVKRMIQGASSEPFYLKPFDIVHVPVRTFNL